MDKSLWPEFELWIKENYTPQEMHSPPHDWDQLRTFYFRPDPNKPIHYGPIRYEDVPKKFSSAGDSDDQR